MTKQATRAQRIKATQSKIKARRETVKDSINSLKRKLDKLKAEERLRKAQAARLRESLKAEAAAAKAKKAKAKADKEKAEAERREQAKKNKEEQNRRYYGARQEAPKQEAPKSDKRKEEENLVRVVVHEFINIYGLNRLSSFNDIQAAKRKFNLANHPDLGGNAAKCKIGNMLFDIIIKKGFGDAMKMAA